MRLTSRLSVSLTLGVATVSLAFAYYQTRAQTRAMQRDLSQQALMLGPRWLHRRTDLVGRAGGDHEGVDVAQAQARFPQCAATFPQGEHREGADRVGAIALVLQPRHEPGGGGGHGRPRRVDPSSLDRSVIEAPPWAQGPPWRAPP